LSNAPAPVPPQRPGQPRGGLSTVVTLPPPSRRSTPPRLEMLGIRGVQVPAASLQARESPAGDGLDLPVDAGRPRFFPLALGPATEVRLVSSLSGSVGIPPEGVGAHVHARVASGRGVSLPPRAGLDPGGWGGGRPDVRRMAAHYRAPVAESWPGPDGSFQGHRYQAVLRLPGRYWVDGVRVEREGGPGGFLVARLAVFDAVTGRTAAASLAAG